MVIKLIKHIPIFLLGGILVLLLTMVNLNEYSFFHVLDYMLLPIGFLIVILSLIYKWHHKVCFILAILFISNYAVAGVNSQAICAYYQAYSKRIEAYAKDYFKKDEKCDEGMLQKARDEARENRLAPTEVIKGVSEFTKDWSTGSCATQLMSICSEYNRRNPESVVRTYSSISNQGVGKTLPGKPATACWPCDMALVVFTVIQELSYNLSDMMSYIAFQVLIWCTAFWLLVKAAGMVLTSKGGTYFAQISGGLLGVLIAAIVLNHPKGLATLYSNFLSPVMQIGLTLSQDIQESVKIDRFGASSAAGGQPFYKKLEERKGGLSLSTFLNIEFADYCSPVSLANLRSSILPTLDQDFNISQLSEGKTLLTAELQEQLLCMTQKFYFQTKPFITIGQSLISFASRNTQTLKGATVRLPSNLLCFIVGFGLILLFTYFSFMVAFRIMEIFLKLGFVLVLMPIFVVTTVFPITRKYTQKAWSFLFQTIVDFLGLAIAASFIMIMLEKVIGVNSDKIIEAVTAPYSNSYGEKLLNAITYDMTFAFPLFLLGALLIGNMLMRNFPIVIASLFDVTDSSNKGKVTNTLMGAGLVSMKNNVLNFYGKAKNNAKKEAENPYKTKETKAKEAEKNLKDKEKKLSEEKKKLEGSKQKLNHVKGTSQEGAAKKEVEQNQKNVDKAQKEVDDAKQRAEALRSQADKEKQNMQPSQSSYSARRFSKDTGNAIRKGGSKTAEVIDKIGTKTGGFLMKNGLGALVGVPLVIGTKALSRSVRAGTKLAEWGVKGTGLIGAGIQAATGFKSAPKKKPEAKKPEEEKKS